MAFSDYSSTGAWLSTPNGIVRIWGQIGYTATRTNNTVYFSNTFARIQYRRETGNWVTFYNNNYPGWAWKLFVDGATERAYNDLRGTRSVDSTDDGSAVSFSIGVANDTTNISGKISAYFYGDPYTDGWHTLYIPTVSAPFGQVVYATDVTSTTATLTASLASWGDNCTAGTGQRIEYSKQGSGNWINLEYSTEGTHVRYLSGLTPGTIYEMRTFALNGAGLWTNSSTTTFTTKPSGMMLILTGML